MAYFFFVFFFLFSQERMEYKSLIYTASKVLTLKLYMANYVQFLCVRIINIYVLVLHLVKPELNLQVCCADEYMAYP